MFRMISLIFTVAINIIKWYSRTARRVSKYVIGIKLFYSYITFRVTALKITMSINKIIFHSRTVTGAAKFVTAT
jgi:hypothetical protein